MRLAQKQGMFGGMEIRTQDLRLRSRDGHELDAHVASPLGHSNGAVVLAQEMYGLNGYLKETCAFFASHGFVTIAPALYDRKQRGLVFRYDKESHDEAQKVYKTWDFNAALDDLAAAREHVKSNGPVSVVGYCWGGTLAWLAACRSDYDGAVAYYGSMMPDFANETPRCPVIAIVGDRDNTMPPERLKIFRDAQPDVPLIIYEGAQHGFDNPGRADRFHQDASRMGRRRTLEFLSSLHG